MTTDNRKQVALRLAEIFAEPDTRVLFVEDNDKVSEPYQLSEDDVVVIINALNAYGRDDDGH